MADLGAIGTRARARQYYGTADCRAHKKDRLRPYMRTRYVTGTFIRDKALLRTPGRFRFVPFYLDPGNVEIDPCNGLIAGTTRQNGIPAPFKPVFLFHRPNMMRVRSAVSDANGAFSFPHVALSTTYLVFSLDKLTGELDFNAAIADAVTPEPMS